MPVKVLLADREAQIMQILWEHAPATVTQVRDRLEDDLAYTTVLTILRNLEAKGYVGHDRKGRAHRYSPLVDRETARRNAIRDLATKLFQGSTGLLLTQLVSDQGLTDQDVKRIQRLLRERSRGGRS